MKSQMPAKYFRIYITENHDHYKSTLVSMLRAEGANVKDAKEFSKLGEIFFNMFQMIAIYNVFAFRKKSDKLRSTMGGKT
jgi:hypothetical protein